MKGLIFTYGLTYGGAVISLFNPFYGLLIYFCFAIIKPESMWYWSVPPGSYSRIVAVALLAGWVLQGMGSWDFGRAKPIVLCLMACWAWWFASAAFAPLQGVAWRSFEAQSKIFLPFLVGMTIIHSQRQLRMLAWVLMLSQAYVAWELNLSYLAGYNRLTDVGFGGMDNNCVSIAMVTGAGLAFFLGLNDPKLWRKWLCFAAAGLMAHVPMFGFSRGGMLGLIALGMTAFILIPKQPKHYAIFALAVIVALRLAGPAVIDRFMTVFVDASERDVSAQSRLDMWAQCIELMIRFPLFGIGPNHFTDIAWMYGGFQGKEAHNLWLQQGAELGIPGMVLLIGIFGFTILRLWQLLLHAREFDPWFADTARMVIAALVGFGVSSMFVSLETLELPYYTALLGAAAVRLAATQKLAVVALPVAERCPPPEAIAAV